ncbi:hypothetical protein IM816_07090 [Luteibacter flocculans]|uniref:Uncharacterized protein n=1 Tax=Luteibacter flocculans TaxID=2780091 RepID=A0ABY4T7E4_9GAMM|nr:hypothetical protein [Luteibacter flocculans]URL59848.1 hypothetical protein IM816_07090 [Luteibacter flocculans]
MNDITANFVRMPGPLKVLTLLSLMSVLLVAATIIPGGAVVGHSKIELRDWWVNGSGLVLVAAVGLFFSAGILLLRARRLGRLAYLSGFAGFYIAAYAIEGINGVSYASRHHFLDLFFATAQLAALSAYFFLSRRVRNFLAG